MTITDEQRKAFAALDGNLHPPIITEIAAKGSRQDWMQIHGLIETLRPIFAPPAAEEPKAPARKTSKKG